MHALLRSEVQSFSRVVMNRGHQRPFVADVTVSLGPGDPGCRLDQPSTGIFDKPAGCANSPRCLKPIDAVSGIMQAMALNRGADTTNILSSVR